MKETAALENTTTTDRAAGAALVVFTSGTATNHVGTTEPLQNSVTASIVDVVQDSPTTFDPAKITVSLFEGCKQNRPAADCQLSDVIDLIRDKSSPLRDKIEKIRNAGQAGDKDKVRHLKENLLAITSTGVFSARNNSSLKKYSGFYIVDLDDLDDKVMGKKVLAAKQKIIADPHTHTCFISPSGTGLKVGVRLNGDESRFRDGFFAVEKYFREVLGMKVDPSRKDIAGLCFLSYDPELFLNVNAVPFEPQAPAPNAATAPVASQRTKTGLNQPTSAASDYDNNADTEKPELKKVVNALSFIDPAQLTYDEWLHIGMALYHWSDGDDDGLQLWDEFSQRDEERYDEAVIEPKWDSFGSSQPSKPVTVGSLFALAKEFGWKPFETPVQWFNRVFPGLEDRHGKVFEEEWVADKRKDKEGNEVECKTLQLRGVNEDYLAATLGKSGSPKFPTVYSPLEKTFFQYVPESGLFLRRESRGLEAQVSEVILDCARDCRFPSIDTSPLEFSFRRTKKLQDVMLRAKGLLAVPDDYFTRNPDIIPCANGVLKLEDMHLVQFSPKHRLRGKLAVSYDDSAKCPEWKAFLASTLPEDDVDVIQQIAGLILTGENISQVVTLFIGQRGGEGKGTLVRVLTGIVGLANIAELRTEHLADRFEKSKLRHKFLAHGSDVPADFLTKKAAQHIKAITGGDIGTVEYKNSNHAPSEIMRVNVLITSNTRLRVRLEGDSGAWRRRLVVIEFKNTPVSGAKVDPHLSERLIATEGSGILNWMLAGYKKLKGSGWTVRLNDRQIKVRDGILMESEGYTQFVHEMIEPSQHSNLTVTNAYEPYVRYCMNRGWTPLTRYQFGSVIEDAVTQIYGVTPRNDILDVFERAQKGWRGLRIAVG